MMVCKKKKKKKNFFFFFFCIFTSGRFCLTPGSAGVGPHFREAPGWSGRVHMYGCQCKTGSPKLSINHSQTELLLTGGSFKLTSSPWIFERRAVTTPTTLVSKGRHCYWDYSVSNDKGSGHSSDSFISPCKSCFNKLNIMMNLLA